MRYEGKETIKVERGRVWAFLTDPQKVSECMPGLDSFEVLEPGKKFRSVGAVGFGAVKVKFTNDVEWTELDPPNRAQMKMHGTAPGSSVDVVSEMRLSDGPDGATNLEWSADVRVVGSIASLAARFMGPVTQRLTTDFFRCVKQKLEA